jgi:hypothetical protein
VPQLGSIEPAMIESSVPSCDLMPPRAGIKGLIHVARFTNLTILSRLATEALVCPASFRLRASSEHIVEEILLDWDWVE